MSNCGSSTPQPVEQGLFDRPCRTAAVRSPFQSRSGSSISTLSNYSRSTWSQIRDFPWLATTFTIFHKNNINCQKNRQKPLMKDLLYYYSVVFYYYCIASVQMKIQVMQEYTGKNRTRVASSGNWPINAREGDNMPWWTGDQWICKQIPCLVKMVFASSDLTLVPLFRH